ncbi:MAG TPA: RdgB/HAM1 family non-canonical purine NTP pyrophosphatase [Candidatus Acidoferrales bacterium]|nr:RdgB/HAM1 family non-canonical purine NTP pyrophosphatase [Candidatus Acidoferrales bacterium]
MPTPLKLFLASSNPGKLHEYQTLAARRAFEVARLPGLDALPRCEESAPTFAENAAAKALHYSRSVALPVIADDSGLVVPALGGKPGVHSARYAGPQASDADRIRKLLEELRRKPASERQARFVCVVALAERGSVLAVCSDAVSGELLHVPRGEQGFGYDPVFFFPPLGKSFAELSRAEKNLHSHRGKAFRKLLALLESNREVEAAFGGA